MIIRFKSELCFSVLALLIFFSEARGQSASWQTRSSQGFTARGGLSSSIVGDKIYVIGGSLLDTLEIYDPEKDAWSTPATQGYVTTLYEHTASVVNGKIYIIAGVKNNFEMVDSVYVYDPPINTWTTIDPGEAHSFTQRYGLTSCAIGDSIYAIGGFTGPGQITNVVEVFNTETSLWSTPVVTKDSLQPMLSPVSSVMGGKIYVVGHAIDTTCHCDVQVYDPQSNKWSIPHQEKMNIQRAYFAANEINGKIYIVSGYDFYNNITTDATEVFDTTSGTWSVLQTTGIFTKRFNFASSTINNKIYAFGGGDIGLELNTNEVLTIGGSSVETKNGKINYNERIYPNPATTSLHIISVEPSMPYKIIDVLGRIVISGMTLDHATLTVDISSLPRGIYYVMAERSDRKGVFAIAGKFSAIDK